MSNQPSKKKPGINVSRFTQVHRKVGLIFMPLLLVIVITGGLSLFRAELLQWQFPHYDVSAESSVTDKATAPESRKSWQELVTIAREQHGFMHNDFSIHDKERYGNFVLFYHKEKGVEDRLFLDPATGQKIDSSEESLSEVAYDLHLSLLLPTSWGKYLVGLLGLLLTYLVFSGFLAHKNIGKSFYRLRLHKGRQIFATDFHKLLGSWSLAFSGLLGITGALIGLFGIVLLILALAAYGGDSAALFADFLGTTPKAVGGVADYMSLDVLYDLAMQQWQGFKISTIEVHNFADPAMHVTFEGELMNGFLTQQHVTFNAINGQTSFITDFTDKGAGGYMYSALPSLHFASFGGIWLKLIYWFLTLILLLVMVTGMTIKSLRLKERKFSTLDRLVTQLSQAVILASAVALLFAVGVSIGINPGKPMVVGWIMLGAVTYTALQSTLFKGLKVSQPVNLSVIILALTAVIELFDAEFLSMTVCLSFALFLFVSQKVGGFVAKAQDKDKNKAMPSGSSSGALEE